MRSVSLVASVVQLFHLTPYAVARSMASKEVGESEQGRSYLTTKTRGAGHSRSSVHPASVLPHVNIGYPWTYAYIGLKVNYWMG